MARQDGPAVATSLVPRISKLGLSIHGNRPALVLVVLLSLIAWEAIAAYREPGERPSAGDWQGVVAHLRDSRGADEPILVAPRWLDPLARYHLGSLLTPDLATLSDVDRHARVWHISARGARHPWLSGMKPAESRTFGALRLDRHDKEAVTVAYDFYRSIADAAVTLQAGSQAAPCAWDGKRFACGPSWNWVGQHLAEVDFQPYRCIYAHPANGKRLVIEFPAAIMGSKLVGYTGIDDVMQRKRGAAPVNLAVYLGDEKLGEVWHQNPWPWRRFEFDTGALAGQSIRVRFEIAAPNATGRSFCFHAETRR